MPILHHVYDTLTGTYVDVEVSAAVYNCCRRTAWNIRYNDRRFYAHEIQFSSLLGGEEDAFENFREFLAEELDPEYILCLDIPEQALLDALMRLTKTELQLLRALVIGEEGEHRYAQQTGLSQQAVHNRKKKILHKLKQFLRAEGRLQQTENE